MARKKKMNFKETFLVSLTTFFIGGALGVGSSIAYSLNNVKTDEKEKTLTVGTVYDGFQVHFLELGNIYAGDSIYIKAGENDILIDAGSRENSSKVIKEYLSNYVSDNKLEYVIATHAHQDHIAAFGAKEGIMYSYEIDNIIDFPLTNASTKVYEKYLEAREYAINLGANHYTALECYNNENGAKNTYELGDSMSMQILYNHYYEEETKNENDYSVCVLFKYKNVKYLLTGDLEEKGEKYLATNHKEDLENVDVFKAGHHGSYTASTDELLSILKPSYSVVTCVCGSYEYTNKEENTFPSQNYIDRISNYTDQVYVTSLCNNYETGEYTSMNGNVIISSNGNEIAVSCSNNNTILKDTEWFKNNRTLPSKWKDE